MAGVPGQERVSDARVKINLVDINDNPPIFQQEVSSLSETNEYVVKLKFNLFPELHSGCVRKCLSNV